MDEEAVGMIARQRFPELLQRPLRRGMCRDRKVHDAAPLVYQHHKRVQNLEPDRRHKEEAHRHECLQMVVEERPPGLSYQRLRRAQSYEKGSAYYGVVVTARLPKLPLLNP